MFMLTNYKTVLVSKKQLTGNVYFFTFKLIDPLEINFIPGQYLILKVKEKPRLYSIFSSNKIKNQLEFLVEIVPGGLASTFFLNLKINDLVEFSGPLGQFVLKKNNNKKIFLATGTGIAPVMSILTSHQSPVTNHYLYWGLKTYQDVYLLDQVKNFNVKICLSREQNINIVPELDRKYFDLGHVDDCFFKLTTNHQPPVTNYEFYLCGSKTTVESIRANLLSKNISQENIVFEKF